MCGIAGCFHRRGGPVDRAALDFMTDALAHRGPDGRGTWCRGSIGLGHRRLAIRDLSNAGRQPMADRSGRIVVSFNGEIYNDRELRQELARDYGATFCSACDTETIPYAFLAWGEWAFERLEGMFAIALWDNETESLYLARDAIGIKPLFYADANGTLLFGSEAKAIFTNPAVRRRLDPEGLHTFLASGHAGPAASIYAGIRQVAPGTVISFTARTERHRCFWTPVRTPVRQTMESAADALEAALARAVESQVVSDVPLGVLQSGGVDSTLVTLAAARAKCTAPIFTAAFSENSYNETDLAAKVARVARRSHQIVHVDSADDLGAVVGAIAHHVDGQCADPGLIAYYRLARHVRAHTSVVLSGDGGDEFFAGYQTYVASRLAGRLPFLQCRMTERLGWFSYHAFGNSEQRLPLGVVATRALLGLGAGDAPPHLQWRRLVPRPMLHDLYGPSMSDLIGCSPYRTYLAGYDAQDGDVLDKALAADQQYHLQSVLMKVDTMSMAHGLEVRVPLLDRRIMDLAATMPSRLLLSRRGRGKMVLRELAARMGAPACVTQGGKRGFNVPLAKLMREGMAPLGDRVFDRDADILAPHIRPDALRRLWRDHRTRSANHAFALWPLLLLATYLSGMALPGTVAAARPLCEPAC